MAGELSTRAIAAGLGRCVSTISRKINRKGGYAGYRTTQAYQPAWDRSHRPKRCKLSCNTLMSGTVAANLSLQWSTQQIAGCLKREYPQDESCQVSHETIYHSLFIQASGVLKKELQL